MKNKKISLEIEGVEKNSMATSERFWLHCGKWPKVWEIRALTLLTYLLMIKCTKYLLIPVFILLFITLSSWLVFKLSFFYFALWYRHFSPIFLPQNILNSVITCTSSSFEEIMLKKENQTLPDLNWQYSKKKYFVKSDKYRDVYLENPITIMYIQ